MIDDLPPGVGRRDGANTPLALAVARLLGRTPEQLVADRATVLATARRGRPLPAGRTLAEVVEGTWPGDESDVAIGSALDRLS